MNKKVLFSPVGGTDPMSETNFHDGALIHIARHYRPDVIYLYMSREILQKHRQDNRYLYCIEKLGELLNHKFETHIIERENLVQVQLFDPVFADFEQLLGQIEETLDGSDELLLNISSGTPAMKSALLVLATMTDIPCQCIQVDTPTRRMGTHEHSEQYDPQERWELNPDNSDYQPGDVNYDRTHAEKLISLKRLKYEEVIKKQVKAYDYHAALLLAETMRVEDTTPYLVKLRLADARQRLDFYAVNAQLSFLDEAEKAIYSPVRSDESRRVYEYMLALQAKAARAEYADFVRGISPLLSDLFESILIKQTDFNAQDYILYRGKMPVWDIDKLRASAEYGAILDEAFNGEFQGGWVKSVHFLRLMEELIKDEKVLECVRSLRKVEESVRNMAAHEMVSISEQVLQRETGFSSREIVELIRQAFTYTSYNIKKDLWDSYDRMNENICASI